MSKSVMEYFEDICAIPHGSGNTDKIANFCCGIAEQNGLFYKKDEYNNVIIKKPASAGRENEEPVVIQGHLDMVCAKRADCGIDFENDGIRLVKNGDMISADGTTLGADDGIAVAYALALISDNSLVHPPLEIVLTSDEEVGMIGAVNMDVSLIKGRKFINIDSEEEGVFTVSCAGGVNVRSVFDLSFDKANGTLIRLSVNGLTGGHSGTEINTGVLNSNKIAGDILSNTAERFKINLLSFSGGDKSNAIASHTDAEFVSSADDADKIVSFINGMVPNIKADAKKDPSLKIFCGAVGDFSSRAADYNASRKFLNALKETPNGVVKMDEDIPGLVKTSLNLGVIKTEGEKAEAVFSLRSSDNGELDRLAADIIKTVKSFGASAYSENAHPAWQYQKNSPLRDKMIKVFKEMYKKEPVVTAIHAGLECAVFLSELDGLDAVSIGPNMYDVHTVNERVSVSSVNRVWEFLKAVLAE